MKTYKEIRAGVFYAPLLLSNQDNKIVEKMFPYSVGIEWECQINDFYLTDVSNMLYKLDRQGYVMHYLISKRETSVRFPKGLKGLIGLYKVCELLQMGYFFNHKSGIHIHVDFADISVNNFRPIYRAPFKWILHSLDKWNYTGKFNTRRVGSLKNCWVHFPTHHNTMEFRIFKMSFFYWEIVKYVYNVQNIAKRVKKELSKLPN